RHTRCYRDWSSDVCSSDLYYCGFLTGGGLNAGWTGYAPLTEKAFQGHSLGVDFWAMSIIVWAISGIMASTNFLTTIVALRAPGKIGRASCRERGEGAEECG